MAGAHPMTPNRAYYYRLLTLLIEGATVVVRNIFDAQIQVPLYVHLSTSHTKSIIKQLMLKRVVNQQQYAKLYPASGNPMSADFDLTLLTCLLQHICGLRSSKDQVWSKPAQNDTSLEADIVRIRHHRNEILLRMNGSNVNSIPNLQATIDEFKTGTIDEESRDRYDQLLKDWYEMDKATMAGLDVIAEAMREQSYMCKEIKKDVVEMTENIQAVQQKISPRIQNLKASTERYFNNAILNERLFVRTAVYKEVCDSFNRSNVAIISGYAGEGKTTLATNMLLETFPVNKILKLTVPQDWEHLKVKDWYAVFIDDIFGSDMLEEHKVNLWQMYLPELEEEARSRKLWVVVTTRQNILKEAKDRFKLDLFKDENITLLTSSKLSKGEKKDILQRHLHHYQRPYSPTDLNSFISCWKDGECEVGFPECAVMFANNDTMFRKGPSFFAAPFEFFHKCLSELSKNTDEFMPLILLWTKSSKKISKFDLEQKNIGSFSEVATELNYPLLEKSRNLRKSLEHHRDGFLSMTDRKDEYTFSHSVIGDVVGLVTGEEYPDLVIRYGSKSFIMKYITLGNSDTSECLRINDDRRYPILGEKLNQLLFEETGRSEELCIDIKDYRINIADIENTRLSQSTLDISVLDHEAFGDDTFVREYIDAGKENGVVSTPVLEVFELFRNPYCIVFEYGEMGMCLPTFFLAKKNEIMICECIRRGLLTEKEKYVALLLATRDRNETVVQKLLEIGVCVNEDALQIASVNQDINILKLLLQSYNPLYAACSHIQNGNTALISAAKRGYLEPFTCLVEGEVDVNRRNNDGLSALDKAVLGSHVAICEALTQRKCELDVRSGKFKRTPLHKAADMGCVDIVELLLNAGASMNTQDHRGYYPIHSAAIRGHTEVVRLLLSKEKSLATKTFSLRGKPYFKNLTLYHYAVWKEDKGLLEILKEFEIDPNIQDSYGRTPLYLATFYNKPGFIEMLSDITDVEIAERNGYTPLHAAAFKTNPEIIRLLCKSYANIRMVTRKGDTVFRVLKSVSEKAKTNRGGSDSLLLNNISKCVEILLEEDSAFEHALKTMKNKKGEIVTVKADGGEYTV